MIRFIQFLFPGATLVFVSMYTGCILRLKCTFCTIQMLREAAEAYSVLKSGPCETIYIFWGFAKDQNARFYVMSKL